MTAIKESMRELSIQLSLLNHHVGAHLDLKEVDLGCLDTIARHGPLSRAPWPAAPASTRPRSPASSTAWSAAAGSPASATPPTAGPPTTWPAADPAQASGKVTPLSAS
jgi:hypothetical protein